MPLILGTNSIKDTGFNVANSLRFNDGSSDFLNRTPSSSGNRKTWTWSSWIKKSTVGAGYQFLFSCTDASTSTGSIGTNYDGDNKIYFRDDLISLNLTPNAVHRDTSAWYHIVVALDTTQSTASNRAKMWINGTQVTSFSTETYPSQNTDGSINLVSGSYQHRIATYSGSSNFFDGYLAETVFIDGTALDPTSFGEFDTGIWKPIDVSGLTFGTNGFYLDFENSGSLGNDKSGNGNNFTVNNLTAIDQSTDTCTNNFATLNSLIQLTDATLSEGNLQVAYGSAMSRAVMLSNFGLSSGKWYCEFKVSASSASPSNGLLGIINGSDNSSMGTYLLQDNSVYQGAGYQFWDGQKNINQTGSSYGSTIASGDIVGMAIDMDNKALYFHKNGTYQDSGSPTSGASKTGAIDFSSLTDNGFWFIGVSDASGTQTMTYQSNFGSPPFSISSGNSDGNGYGNFEYAVPSGYYALNTKNLAEYG